MADSSQPENASDGFYFHEAYVVREIAFNGAISMQQNPGFVHLAGACLYRLREIDLALAKELGVTVYHLRNWAMKNLPTTNPFDQRYEGNIDFDHTIERKADKTRVRKVKKRNNAPLMPIPVHVHPPGEGLLVHQGGIDPVASELWAMAMRSTYEFAQEIYEVSGEGSGDEESLATTLRRCLVSLLATDEVQDCLGDVGFSVGGLRGKLGERA